MKSQVSFTFLFAFFTSINCYSQKWEKVSDSVFVSVSKYPYIEYRIDTVDKFDYFDCSNYYFFKKSNRPPQISRKDSINMERYAAKFLAMSPNISLGSYAFYPYSLGYYDTVLVEKLSKEVSSFFWKGLKYGDVEPMVISDAIIRGKIIAKRFYRDSLKCLLYKSEYVIRCEEIIHSYFSIKVGDNILVKSLLGYVAGCAKGGNKDIDQMLIDSHSNPNDIGSDKIFVLNRYFYTLPFINWRKDKKFDYDDEYCSQCFRIGISDEQYALDITNKINLLKEFSKTFLKN